MKQEYTLWAIFIDNYNLKNDCTKLFCSLVSKNRWNTTKFKCRFIERFRISFCRKLIILYSINYRIIDKLIIYKILYFKI